MDTNLFTSRSMWTMIHGLVLGGAALLALAASLFALRTMRASDGSGTPAVAEARAVTRATVFVAAMLWLTVIVGTYVTFPAYRVTPPEGVVDLSQYPRALLLSNPGTSWLHSFAMEIKEHVPWMAAMLATAVAAVNVQYGTKVLSDQRLRQMTTTLTSICFVLVAFAAVLGVFVNKVAPLD